MIGLDFREHVAEPANLWIRHSFSRWPPAGENDFWCDLATGGLRSPGAAADAASVDARDAVELLHSVADVVYVPPVAAGHGPLRSSLIEAAVGTGVPLLIQLPAKDLLGTTPRGSNLADVALNTVVVIDLLDTLVRGAATLRGDVKEERQPSLPFEPSPFQDATVVWPLVTGWTDQPGVLEQAMGRLAAAGARRTVPRTMRFDARERRLLAEHLQSTWPEAFDALFHGDDSPPDEAAFRTAAAAAGLEYRLPRPLPAPPLPPRLRLARELAGHLIELGDAAVTGGDACYRAARFLDRDEIDIEAAAREGNLGVLPWLEDPVRQAVEEWLAAQRED